VLVQQAKIGMEVPALFALTLKFGTQQQIDVLVQLVETGMVLFV